MSDSLKHLRLMLEETIKSSSKVFIVGHNEPDFDSIGSSMALKKICELLKKEAYIVTNDNELTLEPGVKKIRDENKELFSIISLDKFKELKDDKSVLLITDTNKKQLVPVKDYLNDFKKIMIIDHHEVDKNTIETGYKHIDVSASSASEIIAQVLNSYRVKYPSNVATYLLAGIVLDTDRYMKNTTSKTHDVVEKLLNKGANNDYVNRLFLVEFEDDKKINDLVFNGTIFQKYEYSLFDSYNISFTLNRDYPNMIYRKEQIAKAADAMLKYDVIGAIALGYVQGGDGMIAVSARSTNDKILDVGKVMSKVNGGGSPINAGARIYSNDILAVEKDLMKQVQWGLYIPEIYPEFTEPAIQKIKKQ